MAGPTLWDKLEEIDRRLTKLENTGVTQVRMGTVSAFYASTYTADLSVGGQTLTGVNVLWSVRSDLMEGTPTVLVVFLGGLVAADGLVVGVYGGTPQPDPMFDPVYGHKHRGLGQDGAQISHNDLTDV